ncbi:MAG: hypothetical protein M3164_08220, partial [Actinomycetota bacterium]|nr:hypothetical protein [Actinomycetota bacterium]
CALSKGPGRSERARKCQPQPRDDREPETSPNLKPDSKDHLESNPRAEPFPGLNLSAPDGRAAARQAKQYLQGAQPSSIKGRV